MTVRRGREASADLLRGGKLGVAAIGRQRGGRRRHCHAGRVVVVALIVVVRVFGSAGGIVGGEPGNSGAVLAHSGTRSSETLSHGGGSRGPSRTGAARLERAKTTGHRQHAAAHGDAERNDVKSVERESRELVCTLAAIDRRMAVPRSAD